jgi:hypothetical protein
MAEEGADTDLAPIELALAAGGALFLAAMAGGGTYALLETRYVLGLRWIVFSATTQGLLGALTFGLLMRYGRAWGTPRLMVGALLLALLRHFIGTATSQAMFSAGPLALGGSTHPRSLLEVATTAVTSLAGLPGIHVIARGIGIGLAFRARAKRRVGLVYTLPTSVLVIVASPFVPSVGALSALETFVGALSTTILFPVCVRVVPRLLASLGIYTRPED